MSEKRKVNAPSHDTGDIAMDVIDKSVRTLPPMKYALGVLAIAAVAGLGGLLSYGARLELVVPFTIAAMVLLFVFHRLTKQSTRSTRLPALVMVWAVTIVFVATLAASFTAVSFGSPRLLREFLLGGSERSSSASGSEKVCDQESVSISTGDDSPVVNCVSTESDLNVNGN